MIEHQARLRMRLLLIGLPMAGGVGLVVHILVGWSLPLAISVLVLGGFALWAWAWPRLPAHARSHLRLCLAAGTAAGLAGTLAYDLARYGTVALFSLSFEPFHVFTLFGTAFLGSSHPQWLLFTVGAVYHVCNGTFFGVAYTIVVRRRGWWTGMLWGAAPEGAMALPYPSWLRIQMLREFLEVRALGHLVYGAVLGTVAAARVRRRQDGS